MSTERKAKPSKATISPEEHGNCGERESSEHERIGKTTISPDHHGNSGERRSVDDEDEDEAPA